MDNNVRRYYGDRLITDIEVDNEFLGCWVVLDSRDFPNETKGYLIASGGHGDDSAYKELSKISILELDGMGLILHGCKDRLGTKAGIQHITF
jgi:hypothetical protein